MVMGQDLFIEPPGHKFHAIHPFYVRKMTGLTDDEEKFLRLYRLGHAKSSQDKLRYNMIIEKIQHYQMAKKSDFEAIRNHRE